MPHFSAAGNDTYICQVCTGVFDSVFAPPAWRPDITGHQSAGNVCPCCLQKHEAKSNGNGYPVSEIIGARGTIPNCTRCNAPILWLTSSKTGKRYPVNVWTENGGQVCRRNAFHTCNQAALDAFKRTQAERQGQLSLPDTQQAPAAYKPDGDTQQAKKQAMQSFITAATTNQLQAALKVIFNRQTAAEQRIEATQEQNKVGFSGADAEILTGIYKTSLRIGGLKGKMIPLVRKKLLRYHRQLVHALESGEWSI